MSAVARVSRGWAWALTTLLALGCRPDYGPMVHDEVPSSGDPEHLSEFRTDHLSQKMVPLVDVWVVVDDSCSMEEDQPTVRANLPRLFEHFERSGTDYHVGVVSTELIEPGPGALGLLRAVGGIRYLTPQTPDAIAMFEALITFPPTGSGESGRGAAYTVLELKRDRPANEGFYRDAADLHILFVSDANDLTQPELITSDDFLTWLEGLKAEEQRAYTHAIIDVPGSADACDQPQFYEYTMQAGHKYAFYAEQTGGVTQSLCASEWSDYLDGVGELASGLTREFFLIDIPQTDPWTLEVVVLEPGDDGPVERAFETCWMREIEYTPSCEVAYLADRNSVTFLDYLPAGGAVVEVRYGLARSW